MTSFYRPNRFAPTVKQKQDWSIGNTVKVGFLTLTVESRISAPGEPDAYRLVGRNGARYEFAAYDGLYRVD